VTAALGSNIVITLDVAERRTHVEPQKAINCVSCHGKEVVNAKQKILQCILFLSTQAKQEYHTDTVFNGKPNIPSTNVIVLKINK